MQWDHRVAFVLVVETVRQRGLNSNLSTVPTSLEPPSCLQEISLVSIQTPLQTIAIAFGLHLAWNLAMRVGAK